MLILLFFFFPPGFTQSRALCFTSLDIHMLVITIYEGDEKNNTEQSEKYKFQIPAQSATAGLKTKQKTKANTKTFEI